MKEFANTSKGMNKDLDVLSPDQYSHSLNSLVEEFDGFPVNDYSNILGYVFEEGEDVVYTMYISELDKRLIFTTLNKIIELSPKGYDDSKYNFEDTPLEFNNSEQIYSSKVLASSSCFSWKLTNQLDIQYKLTNSTLNLYFADGDNEDKYLYFNVKDGELFVEDSFKEIISYDTYNNPVYGDNIDCNTIKWYPEVSYPNISVKESEGGELLSGVYQFAIAPATSKGVQLAQYKGTTNPFHLSNKVNTVETNYNTGLAIEVNISGFSEIGRYRYINLLVIKTINGVTTYEQIATLPISPNVRYLYTGNETQNIALQESEVFQIFPFYKSSKKLTKANNVLFKQGVKEFEKFNLQPIMHLFKLKWYTVAAKLGAYKNPEIASNYRGYMRDEVYMFGVKFILDNGEETPVYQLYGRDSTLDDQLRVINSDGDFLKNECDGFNPPRKWQVYNTAYVTKTDAITIKDCEGLKQFEEGEFGYWVSSEKYPNDVNVWGDNASQPIRGFKFPDNSISSHFSTVSGQTVIHPLGVKLSDDVDVNNILQEAVNQQYITQEQKDRIRGYKIVRGNRVGNESVKGKGLLYNTYSYYEKNKLINYANYPYNDLRRDSYLNSQDLRNQSQDWSGGDMYGMEWQENNKYVFHSPETHYTSPVLGNILKAELDLSGESVGYFNKSKYQGEYVILSQLHYNFAIVIAWLMTERLELSKAQPGEQGTAVGGAVGTVAGGIVGSLVPGIGTAAGAVVGGALGSIIGKLIGGHTADDDYNATYRLSMWLSQAERIIELLKNTMTPENYHWQYQSVGKYNQFKPIPNNGKKNRIIETSAYLDGTRQLLEDGTYFNNNLRESSVYLKLNQSIGVPSVQDNSRVRISDIDCDIEEDEEVRRNISALYVSNKVSLVNQYGNVFSIEWLPVSGKVWKVDEKFREFGGDTFIGAEGFKTKMSFFTNTTYRLPDGTDIYYEDLFNIAYPKYFFNTRYTDLSNPEEIDLKLLSAFNSLYVTVAINNLESPEAVTNNLDTDPSNNQTQNTMEAIANIFKRSIMNPYTLVRPGRYSVDCDKNDFFTKPTITLGPNGYPTNPNEYVPIVSSGSSNNQSALDLLKDKVPFAGQRLIPNISLKFTGVKGKIYSYVYGVPYYITESKINLDLRHATNPKEGNFYPNITDLNTWLQPDGGVEHPINFPNTYNYNRTFSKQNKEDLSLTNDINFFKDKENIFHPNRVIYSRQGAEIENPLYRDNYLYFNPLDSGELSLENGKIVSIDAIESEQVLVRHENNMYILNALNIIPTSGAVDSALGSGSIFNSRPLQFSKADGGYFGSQHTKILNTPYGHIWVDAKRGNVYNLANGGKGIEELTKDGMKNWMEKHLPFHISKHFPSVNIDNAYNGIGIAMSYDDRYKRFFITKLDFIPKISGITYSDNDFYYNGIKISLYDGKYFCNASWTISYSFYTKSWRSFHSFTPNFYLDESKTFHSGLNGNGKGLSSMWSHNITNKSYQRYYGVIRPFEVESVTKYSITPQVLSSLSFKLDVIRNHNKYDEAFIDDVSFNKAIVYNERQNSGLLHLDIIDKENLFEIRKYPIKQEDSTRILLFKNETEYDFNQFEDVADNNSNVTRWIETCSGCNKALNKKSLKYNNLKVDNNYIRGDKMTVRLINDKTSKYKFVFKGLINNFTPSIT